MSNDSDQRKALLNRMLGPAGPEVGCDECFEFLDEYVELELAGADAEAKIPGLRAHLEGCPACHEECVGLRELAGAPSPPPPSER